jgi:hypothetical protein
LTDNGIKYLSGDTDAFSFTRLVPKSLTSKEEKIKDAEAEEKEVYSKISASKVSVFIL